MSAPGALRFEKWEGLGNDFLLVEGSAPLDPEDVGQLCHRHRGVGADGVLTVELLGPGRARMIVQNADGSRPEMCGNGLRCVAGYLALRDGDLERERVVVTDVGERACHVARWGEVGEAAFEVEAELGTARRVEGELVVRSGGREHRFHRMDTGNPHAITFEASTPAEVDVLGPVVSAAVPGGINVEFCDLHGPARILVCVWERGVGRTLACGTGAGAVAALACELGHARFDEPVRVELPGGPLWITVAAGTRALLMRGPARRAFIGEVEVGRR